MLKIVKALNRLWRACPCQESQLPRPMTEQQGAELLELLHERFGGMAVTLTPSPLCRLADALDPQPSAAERP